MHHRPCREAERVQPLRRRDRRHDGDKMLFRCGTGSVGRRMAREVDKFLGPGFGIDDVGSRAARLA
jgi:hypothetical protein